MKVVVIGADGKIGAPLVRSLIEMKQDVVRVGRSRGDFQADFTARESLRNLFAKIGQFDAIVSVAGSVAFAPFAALEDDEWERSLGSKLIGQVRLTQEAIPFLNDGGSITLISGILAVEPVRGGLAATTVNRAVEAFVEAAAFEMPRGIRLNCVSPTVIEESVVDYADFFTGFVPVSSAKVAEAFKRALFGIQTGRILEVFS